MTRLAGLSLLAAMRAAIVQLAVPVLAASGGAVLLHEIVTPRLAIATALVIGGIALALVAKQRAARL